MPRILHTADWQLGLRLAFVPGDAGARLRALRFATVETIGRLALQEQVDAVVVAGDVFDDNGVGPDTLQQAREALQAFGDVPLVLLPGNHDPGTEDAALLRLGDVGANVHVALTPEPLRFGSLEVHPCPLLRRHQWGDPTGTLPEREDSGTVRVALAHGGVQAFGEATETPNRIDPAAVLAKGFDYLALGDWHGVYRVDDRAWYAGAPEPTRFKEKQPGFVLLVDLDGPGAVPRVQEHPVAGSTWHRRTFEFADDGDLCRLDGWFDDLPQPSRTLVELTLRGALSLAGRARLDERLEEYGQRLALLRVEADEVVAAPSEADLAALRSEGFLGAAAARLQAGEDPADADALRLMHRLLHEVRR